MNYKENSSGDQPGPPKSKPAPGSVDQGIPVQEMPSNPVTAASPELERKLDGVIARTKKKKSRHQPADEAPDARRAAWDSERMKVEQEKSSLGLEGVPDDDILALPLDPAKSQAKQAGLAAVKSSIQRLVELKRSLLPEEFVVDEMNKKHAGIHTDQYAILTEKPDPIFGGTTFILEEVGSLKNTYANKTIVCSDGTPRTFADIWLKHPKKREYLGGLTFNPRAGRDDGDCYNIWAGFSVAPKKGICDKYWAFVKDVVCDGNETVYQYLRKWMAFVVQHPDEKTTALVLCGGQGVGKNTFVETLGVLFGKHYIQLSSLEELTSRFNAHLKYGVLIFANEALWGGDKRDIGTLKAMITDDGCTIEHKGVDRIRFKNFRHLIFASNESWPVHIDHDDRRFVVLNVSGKHKEDRTYFRDVREERDNGGREALLYDLLNEPIDDFNPWINPAPEASLDIKLLAASSVEKYAIDAVREGCFDVGNRCPQGTWQEEVVKSSLFNDYVCWCNLNEEKPVCHKRFSIELKKALPSMSNKRPRGGGRQRVWCFNSLEKTRQELADYFKANPDDFVG
jgi:hypothetical protein